MTLDPKEVKRLHAAAGAAKSDDARGKAYEALAAYVFGAIPDSVIARDVTSPLHSEQLDIVVMHWSVPPLPMVFFVECKFWD